MKRSTTHVFAAVALTGLLSGCATTDGGNPLANAANGVGNAVSGMFKPYTNGVQVTEENLNRLTVGMEQSEVESIIGFPPEITQSDSGEIWSYPYSEIRHFGGNTNETTVVRFDSDGHLSRAYKTNSRTSASGNPLLDAANNAN